MNRIVLMGRLARDPEVRYSQNGGNSMCVAKGTLCVDRDYKKEGQQSADFINITAFGKNGEFAEKYLKKGTKVCLEGKLQTGSYTNKDGVKVYTAEVVVDRFEFAESKNSGGQSAPAQGGGSNPAPAGDDSFMNIPDEIGDDMPWTN